MRTLVDATLVREARRVSLRFACEDCVHHAHDEGRCVHGYPAADRPRAEDLVDGGVVLFCKEFELA